MPNDYGTRHNSTEKKGLGYFGELKRPDGSVSTELSIGVDIDGKQMELPAIVPTLTKIELDHLLSGGDPTDEIVKKAVEHAMQRTKQGLSPFAQTGEQVPVPTVPLPDEAGYEIGYGKRK